MTGAQRFVDGLRGLETEGKELLARHGWDGSNFPDTYPDTAQYLRILTSAMAIVRSACGEESPYVLQLKRIATTKESAGNGFYLPNVVGVIEAARRDLESGFLDSLRLLVSAEVLSDFLEQARALLDASYHVPAASLAGAVLEDTLRRLAARANLTIPAKTTINQLNSDLARAGVYSKLTQKQITAWADVRNNSDHGNFADVHLADVADMLRWVERFAEEQLK